MNIKQTIKKVSAFNNLSEKEAYSVFNEIMSGKATSSQISSLLTSLHMKGETVDEITGAARIMRKKALRLNIRRSLNSPILDTCGTGGTGTNTFNISTAVAFVASACGVKVAKHGNRAASGRCGSADVLEELGVKLDISSKVVEKCINTIGIGFLFAPLFHSAMKHAIATRKEIGIRTIFNILGPLSNPAQATCQIVGVYDKALTEPLAKVLGKLGTKHAYVVHGDGPLDEVTISGKTRISELKNGKVRSFYVDPSSFGIKKASLLYIKGGSTKENALILRKVLKGLKGPKADIVLMNASLALMAAGKARSFKQGVRLAAQAIDSGAALGKLEALIRMTR